MNKIGANVIGVRSVCVCVRARPHVPEFICVSTVRSVLRTVDDILSPSILDSESFYGNSHPVT